MAKTAKDIQSDLMTLIKSSGILSLISGGLYREGYRPKDSKLEDLIVIFTSGLSDSEIQTGVVTLNLYVPDVELNGMYVENGARTSSLERLMQSWVENTSCALSGYRFRLQSTISTQQETDIQQHFVVCRLKYEYYGGDYSL